MQILSGAKTLAVSFYAANKIESRRRFEFIQKLILLFGFSSRFAQPLSNSLNILTLFSIYMSLLVGFFLPPITGTFNLPLSFANQIVLVSSLVNLWIFLSFYTACQKKHASFLSLMSTIGGFGFRSAYCIGTFPLLILSVKQSVYLDRNIFIAVLTTAMIILFFLRTGSKTCICAAGILRFTLLCFGISAFAYYSTVSNINKFDYSNIAPIFLFSLPVIFSAFFATVICTKWLGKYRLAPRNHASYLKIGFITVSTLSAISVICFILNTLPQFKQLTAFAVSAGIFVIILLLRVHAARFVNPEALGLNLFLARDLNLDSNSIVRFYRKNWLILISPTLISGTVLLCIHNLFSHVTVLFALFTLELAVEELLIQRRTVILPASAISSLGTVSFSGYGAGVGLMILFSASGAVSFTPSFNTQAYPMQVFMAGMLLFISSGILLWIRKADSSQWLSSITCTQGVRNAQL